MAASAQEQLKRALDEGQPVDAALGALADVLRATMDIPSALEGTFRDALQADQSWSNPALMYVVPMLRHSTSPALASACRAACLCVLDDVSHVPAPWHYRLINNEAPTELDDRVEVAMQLAFQGLDEIMHADHTGLCLRVRRFLVDAEGMYIARTASPLSVVTNAQGVRLLLRHGPSALFDPSQALEQLLRSKWRHNATLAGPVLEMLADNAARVHVSTALLDSRLRREIIETASAFAGKNRLVHASFERLVAAWASHLATGPRLADVMGELLMHGAAPYAWLVLCSAARSPDDKAAALSCVLACRRRDEVLCPSLVRAFVNVCDEATTARIAPQLIAVIGEHATKHASVSAAQDDFCARCVWLLGSYALDSEAVWDALVDLLTRSPRDGSMETSVVCIAAQQALTKLALRFNARSHEAAHVLDTALGDERVAGIQSLNVAWLQQPYGLGADWVAVQSANDDF